MFFWLLNARSVKYYFAYSVYYMYGLHNILVKQKGRGSSALFCKSGKLRNYIRKTGKIFASFCNPYGSKIFTCSFPFIFCVCRKPLHSAFHKQSCEQNSACWSGGHFGIFSVPLWKFWFLQCGMYVCWALQLQTRRWYLCSPEFYLGQGWEIFAVGWLWPVT